MITRYLLLPGVLLVLAVQGQYASAGEPAQPAPKVPAVAPTAPKLGLQLDVQTKLTSTPAAEPKAPHVDEAGNVLDCAGINSQLLQQLLSEKEAANASAATEKEK